MMWSSHPISLGLHQPGRPRRKQMEQGVLEVKVERVSMANAMLVPVIYIDGKPILKLSPGDAEQLTNAVREAMKRC